MYEIYGIQLACQRVSCCPEEKERLVLSQQVKVRFSLGVVCERDEEARTVVWETSKAAGVRGGVVRVKDGEH